MQRIDIEEASKFHAVLALCRSKGANAVQVLDEARMIRHTGTRREDAVNLLNDLIKVSGLTPLPHDARTPMDAKNAIIKLLEEIRDGIAAQH